ncbi:hypothetical protein ACA910_009698 [Epithemia clementina (nom. ined.)]
MLPTPRRLLFATVASPLCHAWVPDIVLFTTRPRSVDCGLSTSRLFSTVDDKQGKKNRCNGGDTSDNNNRHQSAPDSESFENDLERARYALENLMTKHSDSSFDENVTGGSREMSRHDGEAPHVLMTSAGRRRRQLEIELLRQLSVNDGAGEDLVDHSFDDGQGVSERSDEEMGYNDDDYSDNAATASSVVDELMHLWMYEHGPEPAAQLEAMQQTCTPGMALEEAQLRDMMDQYPTWAEPRARLAILLFMKGISDESRDFALEALKLKPWHFDVYPVLIMISLRNQNIGEALYWARQSLPTYRPNSVGNSKRTKAWVDRALAQASEQWEQAERETIGRQHQPLTNGANSMDHCWE